MKKSRHSKAQPHLPSVKVGLLINRIKDELGSSFRTLERYSGTPYNTIESWAGGALAHQIKFLVLLLARLSPAARHRLLDEVCPLFPALHHPCLARDPLLVAYLEQLIHQSTGVTFVHGGTDAMRTFLATALAHSFASQEPNQLRISGYDIHEPIGFVPVDGVEYLGLQHRLQEVSLAMKKAQLKPVSMILLNGLYTRVPELRLRAQQASAKSHLVIADRLDSPVELAKFHPPIHRIELSLNYHLPEDKNDLERMLIQIQRVRSRDDMNDIN